MADGFLRDVTTLPPDARRGGANVVHARLARIAEGLRARGEERSRAAATLRVTRSSIAALIGLTLLANLIALATPIITYAVFDFVVRDGANLTLAALCASGALALLYELAARRERAAIAADAGARLAARFTAGLFEAVLRTGVRGRSDGVATQVERFRSLRRLRTALTGPLVAAVLDAPFTLIFVAALFIYAGALGFVPLAAFAGHALASHLLRPWAMTTAQHSARARRQLAAALAESATKRETLEELGMQDAWAARVQSLAVEAALRRRRESIADAACDAASHAVTSLAVVTALWLGAAQIMSGALTIGGVVASLMVVWRAITPMEALFRARATVGDAARTLRRAIRATRPYTGDRESRMSPHRLEGRISVRGLVVRHDSAEAPSLRGVSFDVAPGEVVAICGPAGAGKSTLLMALLGLHRSESGSIAFDGRDLRGLDRAALRVSAAYAPQRVTLFHGTVAQNIRLLAPAADDALITKALGEAGVTLPNAALPQGVDTRLKRGGQGQIDESLRVKLMLAGLYAKRAPILLLDDPGAFLDRDGDKAFLAQLERLRGVATVLLVTNRPSHMRVCDRIIRLEHGMIVTDGAREQVLGAAPTP